MELLYFLSRYSFLIYFLIVIWSSTMLLGSCTPTNKVINLISKNTSDTVISNNDGVFDDPYEAANMRNKRELSDWLIAPNTRWCGRGNTANGVYNHLGGASSADKCCRKHDHCEHFIPGMSSRYELFNYRPYTLSFCKCDRRFHTCLKMADSPDAALVGNIFFNVLQKHCFYFKSEKHCVQRETPDGKCEKEVIKQKAYLTKNIPF